MGYSRGKGYTHSPMVKFTLVLLTRANPMAGVFIRIPPGKSTKESLRTASMMEKEPRPYLTAESMLENSEGARPRARAH